MLMLLRYVLWLLFCYSGCCCCFWYGSLHNNLFTHKIKISKEPESQWPLLASVGNQPHPIRSPASHFPTCSSRGHQGRMRLKVGQFFISDGKRSAWHLRLSYRRLVSEIYRDVLPILDRSRRSPAFKRKSRDSRDFPRHILINDSRLHVLSQATELATVKKTMKRKKIRSITGGIKQEEKVT